MIFIFLLYFVYTIQIEGNMVGMAKCFLNVLYQ